VIASKHARGKAVVVGLGLLGLGLLAVVAAVIVNIVMGVQQVRNLGMNAHAQQMRLHTDIQDTNQLQQSSPPSQK